MPHLEPSRTRVLGRSFRAVDHRDVRRCRSRIERRPELCLNRREQGEVHSKAPSHGVHLENPAFVRDRPRSNIDQRLGGLEEICIGGHSRGRTTAQADESSPMNVRSRSPSRRLPDQREEADSGTLPSSGPVGIREEDRAREGHAPVACAGKEALRTAVAIAAANVPAVPGRAEHVVPGGR
jgi:hypothetical protein